MSMNSKVNNLVRAAEQLVENDELIGAIINDAILRDRVWPHFLRLRETLQAVKKGS